MEEIPLQTFAVNPALETAHKKLYLQTLTRYGGQTLDLGYEEGAGSKNQGFR
jgi:hypothetical protein